MTYATAHQHNGHVTNQEPASAPAAPVPSQQVAPAPSRQERALSLADPAPFGLAALSLPLAALSWINIGAMKPTAIPVVLTTLLLYGGLGQFVVAMWEVLRGNTFGVVAFGTFGCFNLALWYFFTYEMPKIPVSQQPSNLGLFLALWAIPAFILWIASLRTNLVVNLIFMLATALFVVAAWGNGAGITGLVHAAGWIGIALAAVAWYGCAAALTSFTFGHQILPNPELRDVHVHVGHRASGHPAPAGH
ncbi:MAG TPA: acetate uptake transporter [Streptosporangiaceae bacterium]|nr:acetate uptake transporter [Streptosporangiaceae bacterium]